MFLHKCASTFLFPKIASHSTTLQIKCLLLSSLSSHSSSLLLTPSFPVRPNSLSCFFQIHVPLHLQLNYLIPSSFSFCLLLLLHSIFLTPVQHSLRYGPLDWVPSGVRSSHSALHSLSNSSISAWG